MAQNIVQQHIEGAVLSVAKALEDQVDQELHRLQNLGTDDIETLRQQRVLQMKKQAAAQQEWRARGHGEYSELLSEKEFFSAVKGEERVVCHFYRENWPCKVMDKHLRILAARHLETKFVKIHAEKSPFLTERLKIVVLPTLALVQHEKTVDYVVGFNELGGTDEFSTEVLAARLEHAAMLFGRPDSASSALGAEPQKPSIRKSVKRSESDEDSDFDDL